MRAQGRSAARIMIGVARPGPDSLNCRWIKLTSPTKPRHQAKRSNTAP